MSSQPEGMAASAEGGAVTETLADAGAAVSILGRSVTRPQIAANFRCDPEAGR